jgi:SHS2 domain-containing protein
VTTVSDRSFRILDHPADVGVEARGETPAGAFCAAAEGLVSIVAIEGDGAGPAGVAATHPPPGPGTERRRVSVRAPDAERLLVRWLSEVLYLMDAERFMPASIIVDPFSLPAAGVEAGLDATLEGERVKPGSRSSGTDVKAVTYHGLTVAADGRGVKLTVFFDV